MLSRKYNRRIAIYKGDGTPDGYGGNTLTDVFVGNFWADVKQLSAFKDNSLGKSDIKNAYSFKIRSNSVLNNIIVDNLKIQYRNQFYVVTEFRYDDELFRFVNITANN